MTIKLNTIFQLDVFKFGARDETGKVVLHPKIVDYAWTKNGHRVADELKVQIGWKEGGVDPRIIKNGRGAFWLWDTNAEDFDAKKHLRFTGICKKAKRTLSESGWVVEMTFHDYTTMFIANKPMKTSGMPEWSDTLATVWERICDNTGWTDPGDEKKIVTSVPGFRKQIVFTRPDIAARTLGELVPKRFHALSKPQPKQGASSWDVWQWCVGALGLISYIDKDVCVVTDTTEHYKAANAARAIYGHNIHTLEEEVDATVTSKGILLKSFDPLQGRVIEAFYPLPGDERLKTPRSAVRPKSEGGSSVTANEVSADYEEHNRYDILDQAALDRNAKEAYEERSRQEIKGSFKTGEVILEAVDGTNASVFDLISGDAIAVEIDNGLKDTLRGLEGGEAAQIRYLVDHCDYDEDVATLIARNLDVPEIDAPTFHVESIHVTGNATQAENEIRFHNLILTNT